ncbi:MAG: hypothetical protein P9L95_10610 [Candidatus Tenebribacter mawsonii]|nr:hypothetical protein [Candidatus Tenebribacter mawsonii]
MAIIQIVTFSIAVLGAVLGIINTWYNLDKNRVKLKVTPAYAIPVEDIDQRLKFCVQITNLSSFPLTISDAGVFFTGTDSRGSIISPVFSDGGNWPKKLEPRTSVSVYSQIPETPAGHKIKCAYAITQCGEVCIGTSGALKQIANEQLS